VVRRPTRRLKPARGTLVASLMILLAVPDAVMAQSGESSARRPAVAVRAASGSISVDGRLNEDIWTLAPPITEFVQAEPDEGAPTTEPMEVRFVYDDDALFVGARMYSRNPAEIQAPMGRRDGEID
jgi:hypothetical protein